MAVFALSCFGLLLYLWVAFGGGFPLKPEGYRFHIRFGEATQLAQQADVRISGVPVGKVVKLELGPGQTTDATIQLDERYAPIPRDARAILRSKTLLGETYVELTPGQQERRHAAGERHAVGRAGLEDGRAGRDLPLARPAHAPLVPSLDAVAGSRDRGPRTGPQQRVRQPRAVRRGHEHAAEDARRAEPGGPAARAQHGHRLQRAQRAQRAADEPDPQLEHRLRHDRRPQRAAAGDVPGVPDVRARVDPDAQPPQPASRARRTRSSRSCGPSPAS